MTFVSQLWIVDLGKDLKQIVFGQFLTLQWVKREFLGSNTCLGLVFFYFMICSEESLTWNSKMEIWLFPFAL